MKKSVVLVFLFIFFINPGFSQQASVFNAVHLQLTWQLTANNYLKKGEMLSLLRLSNDGTEVFPSGGWTIYFNGAVPHNAIEDSSMTKVEQVNGDYIKLSPLSSFKGLAAHSSVTVKLLSRELKDMTDYPTGFYIVFNNDPLHAVALQIETKSIVNYTKRDEALALKQYAQNVGVTDIPADQLNPIFPTPASYTKTTGFFNLSAQVKITSDKSFSKEAVYLSDELAKATGIKPLVTAVKSGSLIVLQKKTTEH